MTAKVFSAYVAGTIDALSLHRLNYAVERIPFFEIDNVRGILNMLKGKTLAADEATLHAMVNAGLLSTVSAWSGISYEATALCQLFIDLDLDKIGE
jgi:hypothetical protein